MYCATAVLSREACLRLLSGQYHRPPTRNRRSPRHAAPFPGTRLATIANDRFCIAHNPSAAHESATWMVTSAAFALDASGWTSSRSHQRLDNSSTCYIDENRGHYRLGDSRIVRLHIATNSGAGSQSNAIDPHPYDCSKSDGNPSGFENWTSKPTADSIEWSHSILTSDVATSKP